MRDRAFWKKASKARSKPERSRRARPCLLQKIVKGTVETIVKRSPPTVPFTKKTSKARSKPERSSRPRPCLLQKRVKGTVKTIAKRSPPTVPFTKKRQRHGQNRSEAVVPDRAFWKKTSKARSKSRGRGHVRPCLLQKNGKGTVETDAKRLSPTVPFAKKRQRHGQKQSEEAASDRAFWKKTLKARSKSEQRGRA